MFVIPTVFFCTTAFFSAKKNNQEFVSQTTSTVFEFGNLILSYYLNRFDGNHLGHPGQEENFSLYNSALPDNLLIKYGKLKKTKRIY